MKRLGIAQRLALCVLVACNTTEPDDVVPEDTSPPADTAPPIETCDSTLPQIVGDPETIIAPVGATIDVCRVDTDPCRGEQCPTFSEILELSRFLKCEDPVRAHAVAYRCVNETLGIDVDSVAFALEPATEITQTWTFDRSGVVLESHETYDPPDGPARRICCGAQETNYSLAYGTFSWDCEYQTFYDPNDFLEGPPQSCPYW